MLIDDLKKFVLNLELPLISELEESLLTKSRNLEIEEAQESKEEGYVIEKSLVSFVSKVNNQSRQDVLYSTLLAQRVADKKFPNREDVLKWYEEYINVLTNVGWTIENKELANFTSSSGLFEMENVVVDLVAAMIGQNYIAIIKSTLGAIKELADDDGRVKVFESNAHNFQKGNFQIGFVDETNDAVSMHIGAFILETEDNIKRILFFKGGSDRSSIQHYSIKCTLNKGVYSTVRDLILEKLGTATQSFIAKLDI